MKLIPLSKLGVQGRIDSVRDGKYVNDFGFGMVVGRKSEERNKKLLLAAYNAWTSLNQYREDRRRCKNYTYGKQWSDLIVVDGKRMTEEEYIYKQGNIPLTNNLIRRLVTTVTGVWRSQNKSPSCVARDRTEQKLGEVMSTVLQYNWQLNEMNELNARSVEEYLMSGLIVHKKEFGWHNDKYDCWTTKVEPESFFIDTSTRDVRGWDCNLIGQLHDLDFHNLASIFAHSPAEVDALRELYSTNRYDDYYSDIISKGFSSDQEDSYTFFVSNNPKKCRVIELWMREMKSRYRCHDPLNGDYYKIEESDIEEVLAKNRERIKQGLEGGMAMEEIPLITYEWFVDSYWYYRFMTPMGHILKEGETPYAHKSHPYSWKAYPFIDGEIHSFVADIIDQQRYVNRLISMYDWIIRASAKGVLLFPVENIPDGMDINEIAESWSQYNGVIAIKTKNTQALPQQISNNSTNIGINELLSLQMKLFEEVTGVNGALQGKPGYSGMSASLYHQQTQNATISLLDLLDGFSSFIVKSAYKDVKNIQQCYDDERIINIAGSTVKYEPDKVANVEFDLSITESINTPAYRQQANQFLMQIFQSGQITIEELLKTGSFDGADTLLEQIEARKAKEAEQQQQMQQQMDPALLEQISRGMQEQKQQSAGGSM